MAGGSTKDPAALRTIGELAEETGIAPHVLRYWERMVPALKPVRRAGARRYYRPEDSTLVRRLHHLVSVEGYTLEGAARAVNGLKAVAADPAPAAPVMPPVNSGAISLARLSALRDRLARALGD